MSVNLSDPTVWTWAFYVFDSQPAESAFTSGDGHFGILLLDHRSLAREAVSSAAQWAGGVAPTTRLDWDDIPPKRRSRRQSCRLYGQPWLDAEDGTRRCVEARCLLDAVYVQCGCAVPGPASPAAIEKAVRAAWRAPEAELVRLADPALRNVWKAATLQFEYEGDADAPGLLDAFSMQLECARARIGSFLEAYSVAKYNLSRFPRDNEIKVRGTVKLDFGWMMVIEKCDLLQEAAPSTIVTIDVIGTPNGPDEQAALFVHNNQVARSLAADFIHVTLPSLLLATFKSKYCSNALERLAYPSVGSGARDSRASSASARGRTPNLRALEEETKKLTVAAQRCMSEVEDLRDILNTVRVNAMNARSVLAGLGQGEKVLHGHFVAPMELLEAQCEADLNYVTTDANRLQAELNTVRTLVEIRAAQWTRGTTILVAVLAAMSVAQLVPELHWSYRLASSAGLGLVVFFAFLAWSRWDGRFPKPNVRMPGKRRSKAKSSEGPS